MARDEEREEIGPRFPQVVRFGELVEEWRYRRRYTIYQAAAYLRVRPNMLSEWRLGMRRPSVRAAIRFAHLAGLDYLEVLRMADLWPEDVPFPERGEGEAPAEGPAARAMELGGRLAGVWLGAGDAPEEVMRCLGNLMALPTAARRVLCAVAEQLVEREQGGPSTLRVVKERRTRRKPRGERGEGTTAGGEEEREG